MELLGIIAIGIIILGLSVIAAEVHRRGDE